MAQKIVFSNDIVKVLDAEIETIAHDKLFVLTDENTYAEVWPFLSVHYPQAQVITIKADDTHKNIEALASVWSVLSIKHATRKSLFINVGGGMVTDLGGFAASTFKRGIKYINIPTTLLGAVDAAVGGKTGINFNGLKNEVGVFNPAETVIITTRFFASLSKENILSGYAEMIKHGLISSASIYDKLLSTDFETVTPETLLPLVEESVRVKEEIVIADPYEKGLRKALNLGHTVGHAFESLSHSRNNPVPHGYAVAWGVICELILSHMQLQFPIDRIRTLASFVKNNYGVFSIDCKDYDALYELMTHDKKNESEEVNFTLLRNIGEIEINRTASKKDIEITFDIYRDMMGI